MTSHIQQTAKLLLETLGKKNEDYAPSSEFSNFFEAAKLSKTGVHQVMLAQIAIKYSRLQRLVSQDEVVRPNFESIHDTLLDLAGYSIILAAYQAASSEGEVK